MSREPEDAPNNGKVVTSFVFRVKNVPAALYKAMGGFATNGVNMTKLESYQLGGSFNATQFYADIQGHPEDPAVMRALEELSFFTSKLTIMGVYPAHPFREDDIAGVRHPCAFVLSFPLQGSNAYDRFSGNNCACHRHRTGW